MYIKQIVIQGFKSYKEQTIIEPFSPKHNVIVGRNGSGKSNFFAAIRFVLSDAYTQMHREERQALLHEGTGSSVMSAYVEITFDNSDERFPTGRPELILRRTIGLKKDEYSLDRKSATKADVMNLLESAGFSRSNPYYIVPQGRVTTLTNMKDGERLNLLKEVAGTHVYETRRAESLKIMDDTANKRAKVDDSLSYIQDRLTELEEEKEELRQYQDKEREKRCLEYTLYHREQEEYANALDNLDQQRQAGIDETDDNRERFLEGEEALSNIDEQIKDFQQQMEFLKVDKKQFEDERRDGARRKAQIELEVKSTLDGQSAAQASRSQYENDFQEVNSAITQREAQLSQILPEYNSRKTEEYSAKSRLSEAEAQRQRLYAKQGRSSQFKTKKDRDTWLRKEIDEVNIALATRKAVAIQTSEEMANANSELLKLEQEASTIRSRLENRDSDMGSLIAEVQQAKAARDGLQDQRKELWRQEAKLDTIISNAKREQDQAERSLSHMMDQSTSRGLAAVRRIKAQYQLEGIYGTLAELFEVSDKYKTAVEVTAGNSLFHYVVDTDETASKVMEILQKENAGRVTFMPLNRLRPKAANIPKSNDVVEMMSRLKFDSMYEKAFQQVFGRTVICPNLQIAAQTARSHGVSAITPDGDRSDKKGALSGGFHDPRQSRLDAVRTVTKWRQEYEEQRRKGQEVRHELEREDQNITRAVSNLQKLEQKRQQAENSYVPLQQDLKTVVSEIQKKREVLETKQRTRDNVEAAAKDLGLQQEAYEAELAIDFKKALSDPEESQLETLNSLIPDLRKQVLEMSKVRTELESQKSTLEVELRENLKPRLDQLKLQEHDDGTITINSRLKERQKDLKIVTKTVETAEKRLRETEGAMDELVVKLNDLGDSRSSKQREQEEIARAIERQQKKLDKSAHARSRLSDQMADCTRNIRDLGVLPEEAFTKYTKISYDKAQKRLQGVKEAIKKYGHVNKKAFEQYSNFTRHRDGLIKRRSDLSKADVAIRGLIDNLDQRKDEAIERTFKQVSREFASVFEKLVPAGRGRLIIQRKTDRRPQDALDVEDSDGEHRDGVENYTGVGISVSFNSKHDEQQRIQQLSGGQKSLCALALVFAIQQCDPAPFYLFDEIDANLDAQYRTAVASLLEQISKGGQFICTTFRPEMVHVAEKCYGVSYQNKTSSIDVVGRDAALEFVEGQIGGM